MNYLEFSIDGPPVGKALELTRVGGRYSIGPTAPSKRAMKAIRAACQQAMEDAPWCGVPFTGAVKVEVVAFFAIPPSWPKYKREAAAAGELPHVQKPDASNIIKLVEDAVNPPVMPKDWTGVWPPHDSGYAYADDSQVTDTRCVKRWGTGNLTIVRITPVDLKGE